MFKYIKVFSLLCAPWLFETGPPILRHIVWICLECSLRPEIRLAPWLRLLHIEEPFVTQAFDFLLDTARWEDLDGLTAISLQVSSVSVSRCIKSCGNRVLQTVAEAADSNDSNDSTAEFGSRHIRG